MVVVICCRHGAHTLAGSQFLCKHTWERATETEDDAVLNISTKRRPVASKAVALLFSGVLGHWDLT